MALEYWVSDIAMLMRRACMSASYKPALLKSLVKIIRVDGDKNTQIALLRIGEQFARMYWNQTVVYHLRQASSRTKEAEVVKPIREFAGRYRARYYDDLPNDARGKLSARMSRILKINVLEAFHRSKPSRMPCVFEWDKDDDFIRLSEQSARFLAVHGLALEVIANYAWAKFLENRNILSPRLIEKVSLEKGKRASLAPFLQILKNAEAACFYCDSPFDQETRPTVDHVLPWSFVLEDELWDMVLACSACNAAKSDSLPAGEFIEKLVMTNALRVRRDLGQHASAMISGDDVVRLYEAAKSLDWPGFWRPYRAT